MVCIASFFAIYTVVHLLTIISSRVTTHTRLTALFPGLPGWAGTRKVKPIWILLEQETMSGSGISWAICKSAPRSRQITTPVPHHSARVTTGSRITQKGCIFGFHSHVMTCCISDGGVFVEESNYSLLFHAMLHYVWLIRAWIRGSWNLLILSRLKCFCASVHHPTDEAGRITFSSYVMCGVYVCEWVSECMDLFSI